jgi:hypothetical protein
MLYRELGFDPGGRWNPLVNAGMEARQFSEFNNDLAAALGTVGAPQKGTRSRRSLHRMSSLSADRLPAPLHASLDSLLSSLRYHRNAADLMDWTKLDAVVDRYGEEMRELAASKQVVKDPRFCWTLQAWLASGASIESVVLAIRPLEAMAESRMRVGMIPDRARTWAMNNFAYGMGLALAATTEYRVPVVVLRFPDFLDTPQDLYERLPLPEKRSWTDFLTAFEKVHDPSLVHDER